MHTFHTTFTRAAAPYTSSSGSATTFSEQRSYLNTAASLTLYATQTYISRFEYRAGVGRTLSSWYTSRYLSHSSVSSNGSVYTSLEHAENWRESESVSAYGVRGSTASTNHVAGTSSASTSSASSTNTSYGSYALTTSKLVFHSPTTLVSSSGFDFARTIISTTTAAGGATTTTRFDQTTRSTRATYVSRSSETTTSTLKAYYQAYTEFGPSVCATLCVAAIATNATESILSLASSATGSSGYLSDIEASWVSSMTYTDLPSYYTIPHSTGTLLEYTSTERVSSAPRSSSSSFTTGGATSSISANRALYLSSISTLSQTFTTPGTSWSTYSQTILSSVTRVIDSDNPLCVFHWTFTATAAILRDQLILTYDGGSLKTQLVATVLGGPVPTTAANNLSTRRSSTAPSYLNETTASILASSLYPSQPRLMATRPTLTFSMATQIGGLLHPASVDTSDARYLEISAGTGPLFGPIGGGVSASRSFGILPFVNRTANTGADTYYSHTVSYDSTASILYETSGTDIASYLVAPGATFAPYDILSTSSASGECIHGPNPGNTHGVDVVHCSQDIVYRYTAADATGGASSGSLNFIDRRNHTLDPALRYTLRPDPIWRRYTASTLLSVDSPR